MADFDRHTAVWNNCLQIIENNIDQQKFNMWFKPIRPVSLEGNTLTVEVPSDFFRDYIEGAFLTLLKAALKRALGADARLNYMVRPVRTQSPMVFPAAHGNTPVNKTVAINTYQPATGPSAIVFPGTQHLKINPRLNPVYCFANLVEGECNKMGVTAGETISLSPGKTPFNPLFLFGGPGLGKTHIAQAIGIDIKERFPDLTVLYVTGNEFKTQYMDAVKGNKLVGFMAFYMKIDVLIVDDIQDLQGPGSQNAFFNVFNHLHQSGKQLIFTSDRSPADLQNFEERLLSRFKWGLSAKLSQPDYETRLQMLRSRAFREGVAVGDDVLEFIASRVKANFRELEGALISLIANATLCHRDISVEMAESVIGHIVSEAQSDISIDAIIRTVCEYFNVTRDILLSSSRKRQIVQARQIAMYECRNLLPNCSLSTIGGEMGGKDHATVLHSCTQAQNLIDTDKTFRQWVNDIESLLAVTVER